MMNVVWLGMLTSQVLGWYVASTQELATCTYGGEVYKEGESMTGNPCDLCQCTQWGPMCQLIHCQPALCVDKYVPEGTCCEVCPNNQVTCMHDGERGSSIVPETGCMYSPQQECYCYYANNDHTQMRTYCLPPLPFLTFLRGELPPCNSTDSSTSGNTFLAL